MRRYKPGKSCCDACVVGKDDFNDGSIDPRWNYLGEFVPVEDVDGRIKLEHQNLYLLWLDHYLGQDGETGLIVRIDVFGAGEESGHSTGTIKSILGLGVIFFGGIPTENDPWYAEVTYTPATGCGTLQLKGPDGLESGLLSFRRDEEYQKWFTLHLCWDLCGDYGYGGGAGGIFRAWITDSGGDYDLSAGMAMISIPFYKTVSVNFGFESIQGVWWYDNFKMFKIKPPGCLGCCSSESVIDRTGCSVYGENFITRDDTFDCRWTGTAGDDGSSTYCFNDPIEGFDSLKVIATFRAIEEGTVGLKGTVSMGGKSFTVWYDTDDSKWKITDGSRTMFGRVTQPEDDKFAIEVCSQGGYIKAVGESAGYDGIGLLISCPGSGPLVDVACVNTGMTKTGGPGEVCVSAEAGLEVGGVSIMVPTKECQPCKEWSPPCGGCTDVSPPGAFIVTLRNVTVGTEGYCSPTWGLPHVLQNCDAVMRSYLLVRNPWLDSDVECVYSPPEAVDRTIPSWCTAYCGGGLRGLADAPYSGLLNICNFAEAEAWCTNPGFIGNTLSVSSFASVICETQNLDTFNNQWARISFGVERLVLGPGTVSIYGALYFWQLLNSGDEIDLLLGGGVIKLAAVPQPWIGTLPYPTACEGLDGTTAPLGADPTGLCNFVDSVMDYHAA